MSVGSKIAEIRAELNNAKRFAFADHPLQPSMAKTVLACADQLLMYLNGLEGNGTWLERLEAEKEQMTQRLWDLGHYMTTDEFRALCAHDRELLSNQKVYMEMYVECLHQRIGRHVMANRSSPT